MIHSLISKLMSQKWISLLLLSFSINLISSFYSTFQELFRKMSSGNKMAVIELKGALTDEETQRLVEEINYVKNSKYPVLCLKLNTPGGVANGCEVIENELEKLKNKGVKVISYAEGMCCSAGMHIACSADKIYANKSCIMGSIGVRFDLTDNDGLLKKIGLTRHSVAIGEKKKVFENGEFIAKEMFVDILKDSKKEFDKKVSRNGLVDTTKDEIVSSKIFTTTKSVELGLTDKICINLEAVLDNENQNRKKKLKLDMITDFEKKKKGLIPFFNKSKQKNFMSGLLFLAPFY